VPTLVSKYYFHLSFADVPQMFLMRGQQTGNGPEQLPPRWWAWTLYIKPIHLGIDVKMTEQLHE
jgi:hypothetical protein